MRQLISLFIFSIVCWASLFASGDGGGYRIEVEIQNFSGDTLQLGYYFGKAQFLKDTTLRDKGKFVFQGEEELEPGVYLLVIPPDNKFIQVLVTPKEQRFSLVFDPNDIVKSARFKGAPENDIFYDYLRKLEERRLKADEIKKLMVEDSLKKEVYKAELAKIAEDVKVIQSEVLKKYPGSFTAFLIAANQELSVPDYTEIPEADRKQKQYEFYRAHYFDHFDMNDPRAIRSGVMHTKIDFYLQKLTFQVPDSQSVAIDYLLSKMDKNPEAFQYYLVHFLNESARSKRMGMDAVYVHLVDHYYAKGKATWMEKEQLDKLIAQAETLRPTLIGKVAPDLTFLKEDGQQVSIHGIKSDYLVLFFWDPECGHCKKQAPFVVDFYKAYKEKGMEVLAICTKTGADISSCWSYVKEKGMDIWVNAADQYLRNKYKTIYDIKTTPQIFILDKDKKILVKKIAGEDLKLVMDELLKNHPSLLDDAMKTQESPSSIKIIQMTKMPGGTFEIPCKVNGLSLKFIFDTGASDVSISLTEALFMLKNGYLSDDDILGSRNYLNANGEISEGTTIRIRKLEFGGLTLSNVDASIVPNLEAPLLLGQSAISRLGKIQIDPEKATLTVSTSMDR